MYAAVKKFLTPTPMVEDWRELIKPASFTPDAYKLEQFQWKLLFVADDVQTGQKHNSIIRDTAYQGCAIHPYAYTSTKYTFWLKDLGEHSFPIALPYDYKPSGHVIGHVEPARIRGELWVVRPQSIILLDNLRQNGVQFRRQSTTILMPFRHVGWDDDGNKLPKISDDMVYPVHGVQVYVGVPEYWDGQINGIFGSNNMDLFEHSRKRKWIDKFYKFE